MFTCFDTYTFRHHLIHQAHFQSLGDNDPACNPFAQPVCSHNPLNMTDTCCTSAQNASTSMQALLLRVFHKEQQKVYVLQKHKRKTAPNSKKRYENLLFFPPRFGRTPINFASQNGQYCAHCAKDFAHKIPCGCSHSGSLVDGFASSSLFAISLPT